MIDVYKSVMGKYPTGVTVVTTMDDNDSPTGLTVNSFASVSINPLLILWCIDKGSRSLQQFTDSDSFAVNILSEQQKNVCYLFAKNDAVDRFSKTNWHLSENKLPIIDDTYAILECNKLQQIDAGDHYIFIGKVININKNETVPLLYYNSNVHSVLKNIKSE